MRGEAKQRLEAHSAATLKVYPQRPGVAAKWWSGRRHLTVLIILAGGDKLDRGPWPAGCGRRAPRSASWGAHKGLALQSSRGCYLADVGR